jgi:hypothetical protein
MTSSESVDLYIDPKLYSGMDVYAVAGNPIAWTLSLIKTGTPCSGPVAGDASSLPATSITSELIASTD